MSEAEFWSMASGASRPRALVVGDAVLDRWVRAEPTRLSREAPVPVYRERSAELRAGGAANVALNLARLGAQVEFVGALGADAEGREVLDQLRAGGVGVEHALALAEYSTPLKSRVLASAPHRQPVQVLRLDRDPEAPLSAAGRARLARRVMRAAESNSAAGTSAFGLAILSDYGYGHVGAELQDPMAALAESGVCCVLDPRRSGFRAPGLTALTPNLEDLARRAGVEPVLLKDPAELERAALGWLAETPARYLLATLGRAGMALFGPEGELARVPSAGGDRVVDVSGAGDTAAAWFAVALSCRLEPLRAMEIANAAAGCSVLELGTAAPRPSDVQALLTRVPRASSHPPLPPSPLLPANPGPAR